jgi:hypothetical protein
LIFSIDIGIEIEIESSYKNISFLLSRLSRFRSPKSGGAAAARSVFCSFRGVDWSGATLLRILVTVDKSNLAAITPLMGKSRTVPIFRCSDWSIRGNTGSPIAAWNSLLRKMRLFSA